MIDLNIIPKDCKLCSLHKSRTQIVWGAGNPYAPLAFIGEAPGSDEDKQGEAFVGRAGKQLMKVLMMFKTPRDYCLYLNLQKCHPYKNANPTLDQILACRPYLTEQIQMCPYIKVIVALGRFPWLGITGKDEPVSYGRGKARKVGRYIYIKTYHPSYIMRNKNMQHKKDFMRDIKKALKISGLTKTS